MSDWNIRSTTTSQPINISSCNDDYTESDGGEYTTHLNDMNNEDDLQIKFNHLTVGSLPSIRRERRLLVSGGHHEFMNGSSNGAGAHAGQRSPARRGSGTNFIRGAYTNSSSNRRRQHSDSSLMHQMSMASSLPVPSAPFLNSRNDRASGERLSRIPNMALPESASESFSSKSVPYGSLNESQFRSPNSASYQGNNHIHTSNSQKNNTNNGGTYNLQQRVEEMRKNGTLIKNQTKSGIAALLGDNPNHEKKDKKKSHCNKSNGTVPKSLGIGALLNEFGQHETKATTGLSSNHTNHQYHAQTQEYSLPSSIKIGSNSTGTSILSVPNQSQTTTHSQYLDSNPLSHNHRSSTPTVMVPSKNHSNNHTNNYTHNHNNDTSSTTPNSSNNEQSCGSLTGLDLLKQSPQRLNNNDVTSITPNSASQNNEQLCGSLTGLDILKQTPRGMAKLSPQETKAMLDIRARSRSYSDEVKNFLKDDSRILPSSNHNYYISPPMSGEHQQHHQQQHQYHRREYYNIYPEQNQNHSIISNNIQRSDSGEIDTMGHDPEFDGAFDLDMDC